MPTTRSEYSMDLRRIQERVVITALSANTSNNAQYQNLRLKRWAGVRDELWQLIAPYLEADARVLIVGAGNGDDLPLRRIAARTRELVLADIDRAAAERAQQRLARRMRSRVTFQDEDMTAGGAQAIVTALTGGAAAPATLELPDGVIAGGGFDLVLGDMLYTQLLQPALIKLQLTASDRTKYMRRYDPQLTTSLVQRLQRSTSASGVAIHVHDLACWSATHTQPMPLDEALLNADTNWARLMRHDACDPQLTLERLAVRTIDRAWWRWPFEPNKQFLVRACVAPGGLPGDRR
ncbi:MAG: class I SAM-dependent methyltransferase [Thermoleophilia bacterium]|nr:class I SAM-dependent methyltransferase [Thermoleophilia bacterium]